MSMPRPDSRQSLGSSDAGAAAVRCGVDHTNRVDCRLERDRDRDDVVSACAAVHDRVRHELVRDEHDAVALVLLHIVLGQEHPERTANLRKRCRACTGR